MTEKWFATNTFDFKEFSDLSELISLKKQCKMSISLCLPTFNEEDTIGEIITTIQQELVQELPLLDEVILVDSGSQDKTCEIAHSYGIPVYNHQEILPQYGSFHGKGEALWKSLYVLRGDIIVWIDTDIKNFHPRFVYGVLGPILRESHITFCKAFYQRPIQVGNKQFLTGGGRVTELTARPLLNLINPELSGFGQPMAGEYAVQRSVVETIPFFSGYSVDLGLLIDLLETQGLNSLAQVNLDQRIHRNRDLISLSKEAFAIDQVIIQRAIQQNRIQLNEPLNPTMKLFLFDENDKGYLDSQNLLDNERPPMTTIPEYNNR